MQFKWRENEIIYSTFDKNNKLIDQEIVSDNKDILRESLFDTLIRGIEWIRGLINDRLL